MQIREASEKWNISERRISEEIQKGDKTISLDGFIPIYLLVNYKNLTL